MTVSSTTSKVVYDGNNLTVDFAYPGRIFAASDVEVRIEQDGGTSSVLLTYGSQYTLTGIGSQAGGVVRCSVAPLVNTKVKISIVTPATQLTRIKNQTSFFPEIHEDLWDRQTRILQKIERRLLRTLYDDDFGTEPSMKLPSPAARANKALTFDASGKPYLVAISTDWVPNLSSSRDQYQALDGQTDFVASNGYTAGFVDVFLNGLKLANGIDFDATATPNIILFDPTEAGDIVEIIAYGTGVVAVASASAVIHSPTNGSGTRTVAQVLDDPPYIRTTREAAAGLTVVRYHFPPGNLARYTANDGDGSDVSAAFQAMLNCGEKYCFVPAPTSTWGIATQIDWVAGVSVRCGRGTSFTSSRASGQWTFKFSAIPADQGADFDGFVLNITNTGAHGIQLWECRNVRLDNLDVIGPAGIGGTAIEINGGDDASATYGSAYNHIGFNCRAYRMAKGLRLYTDNTTTPASTTAFCNANFIGWMQAQNCAIGLSADRANTNLLHMSLAGCTEGANLGANFKNNFCYLRPEGNTRPIVYDPAAQKNVFAGTVQASDFVDGAGAQVHPRFETVVLGGELFQLPRDVTMPTGGQVRYLNPYDGGPMRFRAADTYDQDVIWGSHDAADTNFDLLAYRYHATAPYVDALRALTLKRVVLTYGTTIATDASLGNEFDITVTDGVAFAISAPTNPHDGQLLIYTVRNTSGGAMGAITWNAVFKMSVWTNPATAFSRSITFKYNSTNWVQVNQTGVDVPN